MEIDLLTFLDIERIINAFESRIKPLCKQHLLTKTSILIMIYAFFNKGPTAKEVCEKTGLKRNLVSMNIKYLDRMNYIFKIKDSKDKRKTKLYCSKKGKQIVEQIENIKNKVINDFFGVLTTEESLKIGKILQIEAI